MSSSSTTSTSATSTTLLSGAGVLLVNHSDEQMASLIDGDANIQPICTQPESGNGHRSTAAASSSPSAGGGGGGGGSNTGGGGGGSNVGGGESRGLALGINCSTTTSQSATHSAA